MEPCIHFPACGGCSYQDIPYADQLKKKEAGVRELLKNAAAGNPFLWEGILAPSVPYGYRNKMEYTFGDAVKDGPLCLGLHKARSRYDIITTDSCCIVHPDFNRVLRLTLDYFTEKKVRFYHKVRHDGTLRHLLVRRGKNSGEILIDLVTASAGAGEDLLKGWKDNLLSAGTEGKIVGILHTRNDSFSDAVINQGTEILYGQEYFTEELMGMKFDITPFSFFQNNSEGAEILYGKIREYIGDVRGKTVFDLYSGTGTIAILSAGFAAETVGVEIVPEAVEAAEKNAERNHVSNCRFIAGDVLKVLDSLEERPDGMILDPPREGVHPKTLEKILSYGVKNMIYVSCKTESFVKEMPMFSENGYSISRACCIDMFPFTRNVETLCLLKR